MEPRWYLVLSLFLNSDLLASLMTASGVVLATYITGRKVIDVLSFYRKVKDDFYKYKTSEQQINIFNEFYPKLMEATGIVCHPFSLGKVLPDKVEQIKQDKELLPQMQGVYNEAASIFDGKRVFLSEDTVLLISDHLSKLRIIMWGFSEYIKDGDSSDFWQYCQNEIYPKIMESTKEVEKQVRFLLNKEIILK